MLLIIIYPDLKVGAMKKVLQQLLFKIFKSNYTEDLRKKKNYNNNHNPDFQVGGLKLRITNQALAQQAKKYAISSPHLQDEY